ARRAGRAGATPARPAGGRGVAPGGAGPAAGAVRAGRGAVDASAAAGPPPARGAHAPGVSRARPPSLLLPLERRQVPDADELIDPARGQALPVGREGHGRDRALVAVDALQFLPR